MWWGFIFLVCRYLEISFLFVFHSKKYWRFHFLCFALRMWDGIWICVWINSFFSFYYCLHDVFGLQKIGCKWYFISRLCNFESWINDIWFCILPLVLCFLTLSGCEVSCFAFVFDLMIFLLANRWIAENSCYSLFHFSFPQNYVSFGFVWHNCNFKCVMNASCHLGFQFMILLSLFVDICFFIK